MPVFIRKVTRYAVSTPTGSKEFESLAKATDFVESEINNFFMKVLQPMELHSKHWIPFTEHVLKNREYLAHLLGYELPEEGDE